MIYGTRCHGCRKSSERGEAFYELEVNLKPGCLLEERIASLFQEEELNGSNQSVIAIVVRDKFEAIADLTTQMIGRRYRCERCDGLRDATRFTRIGSLPPVLHFSLMRFVYDFDAQERKKTNNFITFPSELNMAPFAPPSSPGASQIYDLVGVLLHQGGSAHFGHYTADVFDVQHQKWFHCDDDSVEQLPNPFKTRQELKSQSSGKSGKAKAKASARKVMSVDSTDSEGEQSRYEQQK